MIRMNRLLLSLLLPLALLSAETGFLNREVTVEGQKFLYQVYVPRDFTAEKAWPVILFLHGAGESGSDGIKQTLIGLPGAIRKNPERFPAIVVMPQSAPQRRWSDKVEQDQALAALEKSIVEFRGDRDRIYLTGLSKGGAGTLHLAYRDPKRFAAVAPVCARLIPSASQLEAAGKKESDYPTYEDAARKFGAELPVWFFHGDADPTVPVESSRKLVEALKAIGSGVRYTEYPGVGHNSWDKAYGEADFVSWLFAQRRKP